jgi:L-ascorbate metabolism protein UlaG (beta-lactamase superfamily)
MSDTLTWLGHANFEIKAQGKTVLIDPFFADDAPKKPEDINACDAILITHDPGDHVGATVDIARRTGAVVVAAVGTAEKLAQAGVPQEQIAGGIGMNIGGSFEVAGVTATMTQAFHTTESGAPTGFILRLPSGYTVYHAGDTGIFESMRLLGEMYPLDLALLPIGGHFTMDAYQAAWACKLLKCRNVVAMHWGTFPVLAANTKRFGELLAGHAPDTGLVDLAPGQSMDLVK